MLDSPRGRWIRVRMGMLCGLLALGLGLVVSAGWDLMVEDGAAWRELAEKQRQRRLHVVAEARHHLRSQRQRARGQRRGAEREPRRGRAPARRGAAAGAGRGARRRQSHRARARLDPAQVEKRILAKRRFAWLKRQISAEEADEIRTLSSGQDAGEPRVRGLVVEGEGRRYYPRRELAGPLLGFVAPDGEGKDGLEFALNDELAATSSSCAGLRDRSGRLLFADGIQDEQALAGHNVYLTIDQGIQYVAERELRAAARTFEAAGGSVVVIDPYTGEVLAMASWPGYNPNDYGDERAERAPRPRAHRRVRAGLDHEDLHGRGRARRRA